MKINVATFKAMWPSVGDLHAPSFTFKIGDTEAYIFWTAIEEAEMRGITELQGEVRMSKTGPKIWFGLYKAEKKELVDYSHLLIQD